MRVWKSVDTYPGIEPGWYEVSNDGQVRSWRKRGGGEAGQRLSMPRNLKPCADAFGYLRVKLTFSDTKKRDVKIHRLVCWVFNGAAPSSRHQVAHGDGNPANNKAENLRWATCKQNLADRARHGTENKGRRNGRCKLTTDQVREMRRLLQNGATLRSMQEKFNVGQGTVTSIKSGRNWGWLTDGV